MKDLPKIKPPLAKPNDPEYQPYKRDTEKLNRLWAIPGTEGLRHRIGGLEKEDGSGNVSHDPMNHQVMSEYRAEKVNRVANYIPDQKLVGDKEGDLLIVSWGGTYGNMLEAVNALQEEGKKVSLAHFNYINPLPKNTKEIFKNFKKIIVPELNLGQFVMILRMHFPEFRFEQYNKIQGLPFMVKELVDRFNQLLEEE
jgi:2-oxoglutarate ferredoxin oxidoreductase subunit alpha